MAEYFPHDYGARTDPKLLRLQSKMGQAGKGIYWDLIEFIYEQGGYLMQSECEGIAFAIHTPFDDMMRVLTEFDLFSFDDGKYYSESVLRRIKVRHDASVKASESAKKRWADAKAMRPHSEGNASAMQEKKSKVKESKEKKIKEKDIFTAKQVSPFFKPCLDIYFDFVRNQLNTEPIINGGEGAALKGIISALEKVQAVKDGKKEVPEVWRFILDNYDKWDKFHQKNIKLVGILSNLTNIINGIKGNNTAKIGRLSVADLERFVRGEGK